MKIGTGMPNSFAPPMKVKLGGSMAAIFAPAGVVEAAVGPLQDRVAIAAYNAPDSVVISGDAAAIDTLLSDFAQRNVQGHRLFVSIAAHSPLVAPALDAMQRSAAGVAMKVPQIPVAWNVIGGAPLPGGAQDAIYWRRHLREPVRFADGLASLHRDQQIAQQIGANKSGGAGEQNALWRRARHLRQADRLVPRAGQVDLPLRLPSRLSFSVAMAATTRSSVDRTCLPAPRSQLPRSRKNPLKASLDASSMRPLRSWS